MVQNMLSRRSNRLLLWNRRITDCGLRVALGACVLDGQDRSETRGMTGCWLAMGRSTPWCSTTMAASWSVDTRRSTKWFKREMVPPRVGGLLFSNI
jgi:hypothetical protein